MYKTYISVSKKNCWDFYKIIVNNKKLSKTQSQSIK